MSGGASRTRLAARAPRAAARIAALATLALLGLVGCANLEPVRDFGKSAALISAFPVAGDTYVASAVASEPYVRDAPTGFVAESLRARQVRAALELQTQLASYFALLAKLAGEDTYSLDAEIAAVGKGAGAVADSGLPKTAVDASVALAKALARYKTSGVQLAAVQELVREGGPPAMQILEALRHISLDWTAQVENDGKQVDQTLEVAVLPRDVPPLLRLLANDRRAQLRRDQQAQLRRMRSSSAAFEKVRAAHDDLAAHLDELGGRTQLRERLRDASADLRALRIGGWLDAR